MSSSDSSDLTPLKKRARTNNNIIASSDTSDALVASTIDVSKRTKELSNKISLLFEEFPEVKYILDSDKLQEESVLEAAVRKYKDMLAMSGEEATKKRKVKLLPRQKSVPFYSLPHELFQKCLSYVGKGHYGLVGLVSKKLNKSYKEDFGRETAFLEMATSVKIVDHCLTELCTSLEEKDDMFKAAAVNGKVDILRSAVKDGYDLFPLIEMKKVEVLPEYYGDGNDIYHLLDDIEHDIDEDDVEESTVNIYYTDEGKEGIVKLSKLVERGHLQVLKYLHEDLNFHKGLQRYIQPAIQYGQLESLKWLHSIGLLDEDDPLNRACKHGYEFKSFYFCDFAVKSGSLEVLKWLLDQEGFDFVSRSSIMKYAICSNSLEMIKFCSEKGYDVNDDENTYEIRCLKSVELYRLLHELGYEFTGGIGDWVGEGDKIANSFDIIKFLRSISVTWDDKIMKDIVQYGTLQMIQYAHEDGCPWTKRGDEYFCLLYCDKRLSLDKFKYIMGNGCKFDFEYQSNYWHINKLLKHLSCQKDFVLLEYFVGKNSKFDSKLAAEMTQGNFWIEGINYILENGKNIESFKSIEEVFNELSQRMVFLKYFHSQGLPWCLDPSNNTHLLSKIACYNDIDDVKWAYENGCKGGVVLYVKDEWEECGIRGIRQRDEWKANQDFFEENDMLPHMELNERSLYSRIRSDLVAIDNSKLKSLVDNGFSFRSEEEKEAHVDEAFEKCSEHAYAGHGQNVNNRKRLALFQQMRVA